MVSIVILLALVIPQFALASWWNPASWFNNWSFSGSTTKTRLLEKRIQESENKISTPATTSVSTTFYVKYDNSNIRKCPSTDCDVIGYLKINTDMTVQGDRLYKLSDLPEWMNHTNTDGLKGYIGKSILSEKPAEIKSEVHNTNTEFFVDKGINYAPLTSQSILSKAKLLDFDIERLNVTIEHSKKFTDKELIEDIILREKNLLQEIARNTGGSSDGWLNSIPSEYREHSNGISLLIQDIVSYRNKLGSYKKSLQISSSEASTKNITLKEHESLMAKLDPDLEKVHQEVRSYSDRYSELMGDMIDFHERQVESINDVVKKYDNYLGSLEEYNNISKRVDSYYQPMIIPQLQVPKTTNCTMGPMSGARGYYTVSCY